MRKIIYSLMMMFVLVSSVFALDAFFYDDPGSGLGIVDLAYNANDPPTAYLESAPNPNGAPAICGLGSSKYVGMGYGANVSGVMEFVLISKNTIGGVTDSLNQADTQIGSTDCYHYNTPSSHDVSISHFNLNFPEVFVGAMPAVPVLMYADDADGSTNPGYIFFNDSGSGKLLGSYTISSYANSAFDQGTRDITLKVSQVKHTKTDSSTLTSSINDATHGISSARPIIVAICDDDRGRDCSDASVVTDGTTLKNSGISLSTGLTVPDLIDTQTTTKYQVVNGITSDSICIGPQLQINSVSNDAGGPLLSSETADVTVKVKNIGNVDVTTNFNVTVTGANLNHVEEITDTLVPNVEYTFTVNDVLPGPASGSYAYTAQVRDLDAGISTCGSDSHTSFTSLTVSNIIFPQIWINGVPDGNFTYAGMINNLTIQLNDSDGSAPGDFANWTLMIFEINGNTLLAPVQSGDNGNGDYSITPFSVAMVTLDETGYGSFTVSPGSSPILLDDQNYSLIFSISDTNNDKQHMSYQGTILNVDDCDDEGDPSCGLPFGFDDPQLFPGNYTPINASDVVNWHTTVTPNGDQANSIWNRIRMITLELTNLIYSS